MNPVLLMLLNRAGTAILMTACEEITKQLKERPDNPVNEADEERIKEARAAYMRKKSDGSTFR